ncbi:MAG: sialate O-acetylesterase, partial [Bacteroidota bacterium]
MVMQRETRVPVWGWGDPGERITVQIAGKTIMDTVDSRGDWKVMLEPLPAGGPYELVVSGKNTITIRNVLFGEVWLCSGQSNMQWTVGEFGIKPDSLRDNLPELRLFNVSVETDYLPRKDVKGSGWTEATPASVAGFSATAYFFGRELYEHFRVPVGLITSCLGATSIETWMSAGALRPFPAYTALVNQMTLPGKNYDQLNAELALYRQT